MKILAISDVESRYYYDFYTPGRLDEFDLIISCGDLPQAYLEFLVTMARCPLLYVHGNHDESYDEHAPEGCVCIEDTLYVHEGVRILGLGGSHRYRDGTHQYSERQMQRRIRRLWYALKKSGGVDIVVTHAPARGVNDFDSPAHRGFACFLQLLDRWHPRYFLHGHIHKNYGTGVPQRTPYHDTTIINAYDHCVIEL
jgi:Icc-related predicted phosphoesterase